MCLLGGTLARSVVRTAARGLRWSSALVLLERLGAVDAAGRLTDVGRQMHRLPLSPRLARLLLATRGGVQAAWACALLSERHLVPARRQATACDLLSAIEDEPRLPGHVRHTAQQIGRVARGLLGAAAVDRVDEATFRRGVLAAYPDRVARRREPRTDRLLLSWHRRAKRWAVSGVIDAEFLVAVDVTSSVAGAERWSGSYRDRASWLAPTRGVEHWLDEASVRCGRPRFAEAVNRAERASPGRIRAGRAARGRRTLGAADGRICFGALAFVDEVVTFDAPRGRGRRRPHPRGRYRSWPRACRTPRVRRLERGAPSGSRFPAARRSPSTIARQGRLWR